MNLAALRKSREDKYKNLVTLSEKLAGDDYEGMDADQKAYDDGLKELGAIDAKIKRLTDLEALKGSGATAVPGQLPAKDREGDGERRHFQPVYVRYGKLVAFKGQKAEEQAYKAGQFVLATMFKRENAKEWCIQNGMEANLKAQAETSNAAGGFLVPTEFENTIIDLREEYGTFRGSVGVTPMGSDSMTVPRRAGGVTAYFVAENAQLTESQKSWNQISLAAKKLGALVRMSTELSEDAVINIADDLASEIAYAFAQKEDDCGWNGDGTSTYGNITGVLRKFTDGVNSLVGAVNAASAHDTFAEIDANDLAGVMAKCPKYALKTAKWYCSQPAWAMIFQRLIQAAGGATMAETVSGVRVPQYMGYDVVIDQLLPTSLTTINGTPMVLFGDLRKATTMGERRGVRIKTSEDRYFEYDQIGIQGTERFDINVHDVGDTSVAGPLLALMGKT